MAGWLVLAKEKSVGKLGLAFKVFFRVFRDPAFAEQAKLWLSGPPQSAVPSVPAPQVAPVQPKPIKKPQRSEALTLLAALQREARLVDFIQEPIAAYSDAQIGAAVRDVHRECGKVFSRLFELQPVVAAEEGAAVDVPTGFDAARFRLTGGVSGSPPYRGKLCHHGWEATKCELPAWTGSEESARIVAPAEVEVA
jgi:hypothetical protein